MRRPVTIIVPVYGDWPSLKECIEALLEHTDLDKNQIVLSNDRGPEHETIEKKTKQAIKGKKNIFYHANKTNLGFVGNCNAAVERDTTSNDILLLNSDTKVTSGFLEPLQAAFVSKQTMGAISPRSNNATIATIPISAATTRDSTPEQSIQCFKDYAHKLPEYTLSPVGHGFCLLIRRECITEHGLFDTIFGKGYGEEVDFCLRIRSHGWECAISNRSFVYHLEARSFSSDQKKQLIETNEKVVVKRYPSYRQQVRDYRLAMVDKEYEIRYGYIAAFGSKVIRRLKAIIKRIVK